MSARWKCSLAGRIQTKHWCSARIPCSPSGLGARWATTVPGALRTGLVPLAQARARDQPATDYELPNWRSAATPRSRCRTSSPPPVRRCGWVMLPWPNGCPGRRWSLRRAAVRGCCWAKPWLGRAAAAKPMRCSLPCSPPRLSEPELIAWALPRAANQFWMLSQPEQATAFLRATRGRISEPAAQTTIDALTATFAMNAGSPQRALQIATEVLDSPVADDTAVAWAASAASLCSAADGPVRRGRSLSRSAAFGAEHPGLLRFTVGLAQTTTLLMADDNAGAEQVAQQYTDFAELQQPGRAIGEVLLAQVHLANGEFAEAAELLGPAAATLDRTGYSWGPLSLILLATALARVGDLAATAIALSRAESRHGTKSALFAPELGLARAWRLAAAHDEHGAIAAARQAAGMAERSGQLAVALCCWRDAVRLGDERAVERAQRLR